MFYIEFFQVKILKDVSSLVALKGDQIDVNCYSKRNFSEEEKNISLNVGMVVETKDSIQIFPLNLLHSFI